MTETAISRALSRRTDRAIAIVLGVKERECDHLLPEDARRKLRKVVLDQFNDLRDLAVDLLESIDTGQVQMNEEYLRRLDSIWDALSSLKEDD